MMRSIVQKRRPGWGSHAGCLRCSPPPDRPFGPATLPTRGRDKEEMRSRTFHIIALPSGEGQKVPLRLSVFPGATEQKYALLAEHIPEPPGRGEPQRPAVQIERHRALHLDIDLVAKLHEILDGAEVDVRRVIPDRRQILGARHLAAH